MFVYGRGKEALVKCVAKRRFTSKSLGSHGSEVVQLLNAMDRFRGSPVDSS